MPETEVEQTPAVNEETSKDKEEILAEEKKAEEEKSEEKKDEEKKEDKEEEKKKEKEKKKKEPKETPPPPPPVHKKDFEKDTVYLYQYPRCPQVPNVSPKCLKVETWLKLNGIKYENVNHGAKLRSKRGILPFIELNGEEIAESDTIIRNLGGKFDKEMDDGLDQDQKNIQHAMVTMVDNHLNGAFMHWAGRCAHNMLKGYKLNLQEMTGVKLPNGLLNFLCKYSYCRKMQGLKQTKAAGFSGLTFEEVEGMGKNDLRVLKEMLGDKQFFFGDNPHTLDLVVFSQLAVIINVENTVSCPLRDYLNEECTNLVGLYNRMKDQAWGDHWDEAVGDKMELNPHIPKPDPPKEEEKVEEKKEKEKDDEKKEEDNKEKEEENKEKGDKDEKEKEDNKEEDKK